MKLAKTSRGKYSKLAAGMESNNIVPGQQYLRGMSAPLLTSNELIVSAEGVQHDGLQNVADQIFGDGHTVSSIHTFQEGRRTSCASIGVQTARVSVFSLLRMLIFHRCQLLFSFVQ